MLGVWFFKVPYENAHDFLLEGWVLSFDYTYEDLKIKVC